MRTLLTAAELAILMVSCSPDEPSEPGYLGDHLRAAEHRHSVA